MTALRIQRQPKETPQRLTYRFIRKIKESGILLEARKRQFWERPKNKRAKKESALRCEELRKKYEELKKMGKA
jgi:ribosomal protein S21